jgi:hypothetical protein
MPRAVRLSPVSVRLTKEERALLEKRAGGIGLSTYLKATVLGDGVRSRRKVPPSADQVLLARVLGQLGAVGIASYLRSLAEAAESGSLHLDDLTVTELKQACAAVLAMQVDLMRALGKAPSEPALRTSRRFNEASGQ